MAGSEKAGIHLRVKPQLAGQATQQIHLPTYQTALLHERSQSHKLHAT